MIGIIFKIPLIRASKRHLAPLGAGLLLTIITPACGTIQNLRREAYNDEGYYDDGGKSHENYHENSYDKSLGKHRVARDTITRKVLPEPATVLDQRLSSVQGTPVDLSGVRAKSGRITRTDFENMASKNENSLWKEDGQSNYLFATNQTKHAGDLITIEVEEDLKKDLTKELKKALSEEDREQLDLATRDPSGRGIASAANADVAGAAKSPAPGASPAAIAPEPPSEKQIAATAAYDSFNNAIPKTMTAEVIQRYPNGNLLVRSIRRLPYKERTHSIEVSAIVRGVDVTEAEGVKSSKFFEQKVEAYR